MDITPVYELRERLKAAAVAGAGLAAEDFRLKRAVEAMAFLEKASPVFARIVQLSRHILEESCEDRAGALLDALILTDAVLCTQGAVEAEGTPDYLPQETEAAGEASALVINAPYSVLSGLLDALLNSGGGRYSYVVEKHREQPELFRDYRVRAAMVDALGASYGELAETVAGWLTEEGRQDSQSGRNILRLLQRGFDPKGKKDMVRRVQVMEAVAGAKANQFYLKQLPAAEKEVRTALLHGLRHDPSNEEILLELAASEKGNNRKAVCFALAQMEGEKTWEYFRRLAERNPEQAVTFLEGSDREQAADLTAEVFLGVIGQWQKGERKRDKEMESLLDACLKAFPGKGGSGICACCRQAAALGTALDEPMETEKAGRWVMSFTRPVSMERIPYFSKIIPEVLHYSVLLYPGKELAALAQELYQEYGEAYFPAAMTAALCTRDGEACQELLREFVEEKKLLGKKLRKERSGLVEQALKHVRADESGRGYVLTAFRFDPADRKRIAVSRPVSGVTEGMYHVLMELEDYGTDKILISWISPENEALCRRLAEYLYERALKVKDNSGYLDALRRCRIPDCKGLAVNYFTMSRGRVSSWQLAAYLERLPGSPGNRAAEAGRLLELLKNGELKGPGGLAEVTEEYIRKMQEMSS